MKILVDIKHPAEVNLFKFIFAKLTSTGSTVIICYLDKGNLGKIIEKEFSSYRIVKIGFSRGTKWSIIWNGNLIRIPGLLKLIKNYKIDICLAASSAPLALAGLMSGTPVIQFYDDPERKEINRVNEFLSNKIFFPPIVNPGRKIGVFNCLKEWSYLSPVYFTPNPEILERYEVEARKYVFVREIDNKSFNYFHQNRGIIQNFSEKLKGDTTFLLSLEDKGLAKEYPPNWKILEEPVEDIHSLIYFSKLVVSSGDSMAREGAMLGVPSVYCGIRNMKANGLLIRKGLLEHHSGESALGFIQDVISTPFETNRQIKIRNLLLTEWDDMNSFMIDQINCFSNAPAEYSLG
jgi:uncharacterized protein